MSDFFENSEKASLAELGEFGLVRHLLHPNEIRNAETILGPGDDASLINVNSGHHLITSTDLLIEGVHFDITYTPLRHLGYKAVAVNLSDLCAMNGTPRQILVSVAISSKYTLDALEELYAGIYLACAHYKVDLAGGDTSTIAQGMVISVTALGEVLEGKEVRRSGAQPGDLLCVSGDLGAAYMGLQLLEREKRVYLANPQMQPDLQEYSYLLQRQLRPEARTDVVKLLEELKIRPTSMIDVSDGLSSEVLHLSNQGKVGFRIYEDKLPIDHLTRDLALEFGLDPTTVALNGGEDYELLFTIPQSAFEQIQKNPDISVIGYVCPPEEGNQIITKSGNAYDLKAQGWKAL